MFSFAFMRTSLHLHLFVVILLEHSLFNVRRGCRSLIALRTFPAVNYLRLALLFSYRSAAFQGAMRFAMFCTGTSLYRQIRFWMLLDTPTDHPKNRGGTRILEHRSFLRISVAAFSLRDCAVLPLLCVELASSFSSSFSSSRSLPPRSLVTALILLIFLI